MSGTALGQTAATLTLRWQAPAGCPQQSAVRDRIRKLTGANGSTATALQAEGTITQTNAAHFHLKLVMRSGNLVGERNLDATSCENLAGAAAVSLALLMRSEAPLSEGDLGGQVPTGTAARTGTTTGTGTTSDTATDAATAGAAIQKSSSQSTKTESGKQPQKTPAGDSASSNEPDPSDDVDADTRQRPIARSERQHWHVLAQVPLAALSFGPLPQPSWGVAFAGGVAHENWRFLLGGTLWRGQSLATDQAPGYGADVDRLTGTLKGCHALRRSVWEVAPCLVLSLEHISARGTGAGVTPRSDQATWLAVGAGAHGRLYLASWFSVLLGVDAQIETARPVIAIDGVGNLGQLGSAAFTATLGPEWIF